MPSKCKFDGCNKHASYGIEKRTHCSTHKTDKMKYLHKKKKCEYLKIIQIHP